MMAQPPVIYVYGKSSASTEIEAAMLKYTDDFKSINVETVAGCGYKAYMMDEKEISLLAVDIEDYGWIQHTLKIDFEEPVGSGTDITRGTLTTSGAWQDLATKTCDRPYTLNKLLITFSGDAHEIKVLLNSDVIVEYIVDHLVIDYPPSVTGTVNDVLKIQIKKLAGDDCVAIGYLYGES